MKKLYFCAIALYAGILASHAQSREYTKSGKTFQTGDTRLPSLAKTGKTTDSINDDSLAYKKRKLHLDEINLVSAWYQQNGNNSAVTGGIGTEHLTDFANTLDLQLSRETAGGNKNTYSFELGVDHYTSASSDKIDPFTVSSASKSDTRIYPSMNWTYSNAKSGTAFGLSGSLSNEYDYQSIGAGLNLSLLSKDKNTQFDLKANAFLDTWTVILPVELRPPGYGSGSHDDRRPVDHKPRNSFNASFSLAQVVNTRFQAMLVFEPAYQHGLLSTDYQRVYFQDNFSQGAGVNGDIRNERIEKLPGERLKIPLGLRMNYFAGDHFIIRSFYRYYSDNWGIQAHTAELEVPIKFSAFTSLSPAYRFSRQQGTHYFAPFGQHHASETYYTSDFDLSSFNSNFFGLNLRLAPPRGVAGWQHLSALEFRIGHYQRSTGLSSNIASLNLKFK